jgi:hypothetical protein
VDPHINIISLKMGALPKGTDKWFVEGKCAMKKRRNNYKIAATKNNAINEINT